MKQRLVTLLQPWLDEALLITDPKARAAAEALQGRWLAVELVGWATLYAEFLEQGHIQLHACMPEQTSSDGTPAVREPDARVSASPVDFIVVAISARQRAQYYGASSPPATLNFQGDVDVAMRVQTLLSGVTLAWDIPLAHMLGSAGSGLIKRGVDAITSAIPQIRSDLKHSVGEYLREEMDLAVNKDELDLFYADVAACRQRLDRLQARVAKLQEAAE